MADDVDSPSSSEVEGTEDRYFYLSDQEDDIAENVLQDLEDGQQEDCSWSVSSVITKESLLAAQKVDLRKVMELLALSEHNARTLLIHYRWDVERVFELLEQKGKDSPKAANLPEILHLQKNFGWTEHFIVKINDGQSRRIRCMAPKCNAICDEAIVRSLVSTRHPDIADRFEAFYLSLTLKITIKLNGAQVSLIVEMLYGWLVTFIVNWNVFVESSFVLAAYLKHILHALA
ncbi:hypothetical protein HPP92_007553 [Vanilla planifolia]|uniref:E3 ubiquitin-protein ligase ARIH1-like UBA-like domain-containing protein n=1 Tax=Vanilla planifolia TaxID=51239 RepID=A0A835VBC6_VANPL|nr:hypothetical protein HPP92_007553 [Vanilla planifolia]